MSAEVCSRYEHYFVSAIILIPKISKNTFAIFFYELLEITNIIPRETISPSDICNKIFQQFNQENFQK